MTDKEFWEWCGVIYKEIPEQVCGYQSKRYAWTCGDYFIGYTPPPIDLNNLFKYAVAKLQKMDVSIGITCYREESYGIVVKDWSQRQQIGNLVLKDESYHYVGDNDLTRALKKAIEEVINDRESNH